MTIAIIQTAFLGDVLLTLPLCAALRQQFPDAHIVFITTPAAASFVTGLNYADEVVAFDKRGEHKGGKGLRKLIAERCAHVDVALVPHTSFRTMRLVHAMHPKHTVTFNTTWTRWLPRTTVIKYPRALHDADRHLQLLRGLDSVQVPTKEDVGRLKLFTDADLTGKAGIGGGYIVLAPGTVWPTKQWPLEYVNELALQLAEQNRRVVVIGDASVRGCVKARENVLDLAGQTTLRQAAALIAGASIVVANDSAPLHIASLQGVPVVGVFGPTVREFGFGPFGMFSRIVERTDLPCRPCSSHGTLKCPIRTHECMRSITSQHIHSAVTDLLEQAR
ncbi:MAG: glycosyltransferase family 9 protein [bacterium]|nr:glycosyltransferase family 9 protein [bacterium]